MRYFRNIKYAVNIVAASLLLFLTSCADDKVVNDTTVKISISPTSPNVKLGETVDLTVTANNTGIIWPHGDVAGSFDGDKNGQQVTVTYTPPPTLGTYTFTVAAEADPSKTAKASVTVVYASPEVSISPTSADVKTTKTFQFTADVLIPTGQPQNQDPVWDVQGYCGSVSQDGLFSATRAGASNCTVRVSVKDNNNKWYRATATVSVTNPSLNDMLNDMVQVRGGTFNMGCDRELENGCSYYASPIHPVRLGDFYIGKYEVTRFVWNQVRGIDAPYEENNLPVDNVSWEEVQEFIADLNEKTGKKYRLPTEAEWEYAARGGNQSNGYVYSGSDVCDDVGWNLDNSERLQPVGMRQANELGLYDMSGNVVEWVNDWFGNYSGGSQTNPTGPDEGFARVVRGGGHLSPGGETNVYNRGGFYPEDSVPSLGFRLAITTR